MLAGARSAVDFSSPPAKVNEAIQLLQTEGVQHWAVSAFVLPQGKKVIEAATNNAKTKESLADVLDMLHVAEKKLSESSLCVAEAPFLESLKGCFNAARGHMVSDVLTELSDKKMKVLKGADRDKLVRVQTLAQNAVSMILLAYINHHLVPYVNTWTAQLTEKQHYNEPMLPQDTSIMHLTDGCGHGHESLLDQLKGVDAFLAELGGKFFGPGPEMEPAQVSSLVTT